MKQPLRQDHAGRASRRERACLGLILAPLVCSLQSPAGGYDLDGRANVIGADLEAKAVLVRLPGPSTYVFRLAASDFKENWNTAPQRHVVVSMDSSAGDLRSFTLNGVGDMRVVSIAADVGAKVVFVDSESGDNAGSSRVQVLHGDTIVAEATADGVANVIGANVDGTSVLVPLAEPGTYVFRLTASDFKENWNTTPQRHAVISMDSSAGDYRTVTLNGVGDAQVLTTTAALTAKMFFLDTEADDNMGSATIQVLRVGGGLPSVSVALHAGITIQGTVGRSYTIQSATSLNPPNWEALTTITLSAPTQVWFDPEPAEHPLRAYRAVEP